MENNEALAEIEMQDESQKDMFLTFQVEKEEYAIEIKYVTQILGMQKITALPDMPVFISSIFNQRYYF